MNLITRTIGPLLPSQPDPTSATVWAGGMGDINPTFFFSPAKPGKLVWGFGPTLVLPTATNKLLGQGKWSAGPSLVAMVQPGKWTVGVLANNVWSFAGDKERAAVNQLVIQYFINYNLKKGYYITSSPIVTSDWRAPSGQRLTLPFGGGIGRVHKWGRQPVNWNIGIFGNALHPQYGASWTFRLQVALLYPKK
jgi:hypothetical protein